MKAVFFLMYVRVAATSLQKKYDAGWLKIKNIFLHKNNQFDTVTTAFVNSSINVSEA